MTPSQALLLFTSASVSFRRRFEHFVWPRMTRVQKKKTLGMQNTAATLDCLVNESGDEQTDP